MHVPSAWGCDWWNVTFFKLQGYGEGGSENILIPEGGGGTNFSRDGGIVLFTTNAASNNFPPPGHS